MAKWALTLTATGNGITIVFLAKSLSSMYNCLESFNSSTLKFTFGYPSQRHKNSTTKRFNYEMKQLVETKQLKCPTKE